MARWRSIFTPQWPNLRAKIVSPHNKTLSSLSEALKCERPKVASNSVSISFPFSQFPLNMRSWLIFFCNEGHKDTVTKKLFLRQVSAHGSMCEGRGGEDKSRPTKMRTDTLIGDNGWGREWFSLGNKAAFIASVHLTLSHTAETRAGNCRFF